MHSSELKPGTDLTSTADTTLGLKRPKQIMKRFILTILIRSGGGKGSTAAAILKVRGSLSGELLVVHGSWTDVTLWLFYSVSVLQ